MKLIKATIRDKDFMFELRKATMAQHFEKMGLLISDEEHRSRVEYAFEQAYLIVIQGAPIGMVKFQERAEELEIIQIQIAPLYQGQGYGKTMIEYLMAQSPHKPTKLTVLKSNPAANLYKRLGFVIYDEDDYEFYMRKDARV